MKKKTEAEYKKWKEEFEKTLPENLRSNWQVLAESEQGFELFNGHLRQQEFDRALNEVNEAEKAVKADRAAIAEAMQQFVGDVERVKQWYDEEAPKNKRLADEYRRLYEQHSVAQRRLQELGLADDLSHIEGVPMKQANDELLEELKSIKQRLALQDRAIPKILSDAIAVTKEAVKGGYDFDASALMTYASQNGVDLKTAFQTLTFDQREKKLAEEKEKELEKVRAEAREEGRREAFSKIPSPERMGPVAPTPVDAVLAGKVPSQGDRVNNAVKAFMELPQGAGGTNL